MVPSQSSSVPFVNVSGSQRRAFSRARCVNTSPVCVNGSTTWQRAACLTWWNLQDHPLLRANKAQKEPAHSEAVPRAAARSLASFPTCSQTPVRKCLSTLKATRRARSSNWRQLGHFFSHLSHVWKCEEGTLRDICEASGRTFSHLLAAGGSIKNERIVSVSHKTTCLRRLAPKKHGNALRRQSGDEASVRSLKCDFWQQTMRKDG